MEKRKAFSVTKSGRKQTTPPPQLGDFMYVPRANEKPNCLHYYEKYIFQKGHRFIYSTDKYCDESNDIL
jgi:hypothetical protein